MNPLYRETHFFCKKFTQPYLHFHNCYDCDNMLHCAKNSINFRIKTEPCNSTYPAFVYIYSICSMTWPFHLLQPRQAWFFFMQRFRLRFGTFTLMNNTFRARFWKSHFLRANMDMLLHFC